MLVNEMFTLAFSLAMDSFAVSLIFGTRDCLLSNRQAIAVAVIFALVQGSFICAAMFLGKAFHNVISGFDHWVAFGLLALVAVHMLKEGKLRIYAINPVAGVIVHKEQQAAANLSGLPKSQPGSQPGSQPEGQPEGQPEAGPAGEVSQPANKQARAENYDETTCRLGAIKADGLLPASLLVVVGLAVATSIDSIGAGVGVSLLGATGWLLPLIVGGVTFVFCCCGAFLGRRTRSIQRMGGYACVVGGMLLMSMGLEILYDHGVF